MTAEPLTAAEQAVVARFDAAPPAEESAVERVARAIHDADEWDCSHDWPCANANLWRTLAAAALTAMRPAPDTAAGDSCGECCHVRASHRPSCDECDDCAEFEDTLAPDTAKTDEGAAL